jgi:acetate kinase
MLALVLNAGSSTLKFGLYELATANPRPLQRGSLDADAHDAHTGERCWAQLRAQLEAAGWWPRIGWVGHRIVHGGPHHAEPAFLSDALLAELVALTPLAPLHQGPALDIVRQCRQALPDARQLLCFDTAFHRSQDRLARLYGLPLQWYDEGVQRYGFHGLSCEYIVGRLRELSPAHAGGRVVVAHLGSGSSLTALRAGRSVASTMGLTPLDGVPMATRSGSLDPGVVLYLQQRGLTAADVSELLYRQSGLLGLSGLSGDIRVLEASDLPSAALALDYFVYRIGRELGSLVAALGGLDALVFTGGIGAHSASLRARIAQGAEWTGLRLDAAANTAGAERIDTTASRVAAWALLTDEEGVIVRALQRRSQSV